MDTKEISVGNMPQRRFEKASAPRIPLPDLIEPQRESYKWFVETALKEIFKEFSPIADYSDKKFELVFKKYEMGTPKYSPEFTKANKRTYEAPLRATVIAAREARPIPSASVNAPWKLKRLSTKMPAERLPPLLPNQSRGSAAQLLPHPSISRLFTTLSTTTEGFASPTRSRRTRSHR